MGGGQPVRVALGLRPPAKSINDPRPFNPLSRAEARDPADDRIPPFLGVHTGTPALPLLLLLGTR